jgi:signal transduction histidine kinase
VELLRREKVTQSLLEDLKTSKSRLEQQQQSLEEAHATLQHSHEEMLAMQLQLIQSEKLESIGRLAAGVAHEVKNPLAVILMGVAYLTRQMANGDPNVPMVLGEMDLAVRRADTVIRGLLDFSAPSELHLNTEDLNAVIDQALLLVKHELDTAHVTVVKELSSLPPINLDGNKIQQVFINLFMNAAHAMPSGGTLTVRTCVKPKAALEERLGLKDAARFARSAALIVAEVEDTGTGIPEEKLQKVFDPFFTTKPTGKGTGLGLTVTKKIVELHEGLINVRNRPEGGARVTVIFA